MLVLTGAGPCFFHIGADLIVLTAVHDGEDVSQPIAERPMGKEGSNAISQIALQVINGIVLHYSIKSVKMNTIVIKDVTGINQVVSSWERVLFCSFVSTSLQPKAISELVNSRCV